MVSIELFFLFLQYIFIGKLEGMKNWTINITKIILWELYNGLYFY